jgi:short-subunit dehydrogenase
VVEVSLFGAVNCTKAALESLLARRGMVAAVSSAAGFVPLLGRTGYCAAKHGMHGFFDTLRAELHGSGVDVLVFCPGFTRTPLTHSALDGDGSITRHPKATVGKIAEPEEVADELFRAACRRRRMVVLSASGKLALLLSRLSPPLYEALMRRSLRKEIERGQ